MDFVAPGVTEQVSRGVRVKSWTPMDKHAGFGRADPRGGVFFPLIYPGSLQRQPASGERPLGKQQGLEPGRKIHQTGKL